MNQTCIQCGTHQGTGALSSTVVTLLVAALLVVACGVVSPVAAQVEPAGLDTVGRVHLRVRTLQASGKLRSSEQIQIKGEAEDLAPHLTRLPFRKYRVMHGITVELPRRKKLRIPLDHGDMLAVRMHYLEDDRVGLWLRWVGADGMEMLDTRMHVSYDVPIVVGADEGSKKAKVLTVSIVPPTDEPRSRAKKRSR